MELCEALIYSWWRSERPRLGEAARVPPQKLSDEVMWRRATNKTMLSVCCIWNNVTAFTPHQIALSVREQKHLYPSMLSQKPPDFCDKNSNLTSQNTGISVLPPPLSFRLFVVLCYLVNPNQRLKSHNNTNRPTSPGCRRRATPLFCKVELLLLSKEFGGFWKERID